MKNPKFARWAAGAFASAALAAVVGVNVHQSASAAPASTGGPAAARPHPHPFSRLAVTSKNAVSGGPKITVSPSRLARTIGWGDHQTYDAVTVTGTGFQPNERLYVAECDVTALPASKCNYLWDGDVTTDKNGEFKMGGGGIWPPFLVQSDFEGVDIWSDTAPYPDLGPVHCGSEPDKCVIGVTKYTLDPPTGPVDTALAYISFK